MVKVTRSYVRIVPNWEAYVGATLSDGSVVTKVVHTSGDRTMVEARG